MKKFTGFYNTIGAFGRRLKNLIGAFPTSGWSAGEFYVTFGGVDEFGNEGFRLTAFITTDARLTGGLAINPGLTGDITSSIRLSASLENEARLAVSITVRPINVDP